MLEFEIECNTFEKEYRINGIFIVYLSNSVVVVDVLTLVHELSK